MTRSKITCWVFLAASACAVDDLRPDYEGARGLITTATGESAVYDPETPPLTPAEVDAALGDGLGRDEAVRLALLNNRTLQAGFMGLGIARADYVQSGLLENPTLGLGFLFPAGSGRTRVFANLAMDVSQLWRLPEQQQVAEAAMQQRLLELGRLAGGLVADTRTAYDRAVAARELARAATATADISHQREQSLAMQVDQGVATELEAQRARGEALSAELDARRAARREAETIRTLAGLLSLTRDLHRVSLSDPLPAVPPSVALDREALVERALGLRLDLRALDAAIETANARVALERERAGIDTQLGVGYERPESDSPTDHVLGPTLGLEVPIFDRNEAQISRAVFEREQLLRAREALDSEVRQQVRTAADGAAVTADAARFLRDELVAQAERRAALALHAYRQGSITRLALLDAEQALAKARAMEIEAALDASLAAVALVLAVGGPLEDEGSEP